MGAWLFEPAGREVAFSGCRLGAVSPPGGGPGPQAGPGWLERPQVARRGRLFRSGLRVCHEHGTLFHGAYCQEVRHVRRLRLVHSKKGRLPFHQHSLLAADGEPASPRLARPNGQELRRPAVPIV